MENSSSQSVGRPLIPIDLDRVRYIASLGLNATQVADRLGICRRTLFNRLESEPTFRAAMDEGLAEATELASQTLFRMGLEGNVTALIFWLKTKGGYHIPKEKVEASPVTVYVNNPIPPIAPLKPIEPSMTAEEMFKYHYEIDFTEEEKRTLGEL